MWANLSVGEEEKKKQIRLCNNTRLVCNNTIASKEVEEFRRAYPKIRVLAFPKFTRKV